MRFSPHTIVIFIWDNTFIWNNCAHILQEHPFLCSNLTMTSIIINIHQNYSSNKFLQDNLSWQMMIQMQKKKRRTTAIHEPSDSISTHSLLWQNEQNGSSLIGAPTVQTDMSYYFQHSFVRSQLLTLHHAALAIRLPWHFPDDSREILETKGSLNGFYPLQQVWCFLIDRLIPWRNWMHQGKRLMKQFQTWIPSTHYPTHSLSDLSVLQHGPASGSSLFSPYHLPLWEEVERSD